MYILVLNCGSSSVKFQLFDKTTQQSLARGLIEKIGSSVAGLKYVPLEGPRITEQLEVLDHAAAIRLALRTLTNQKYGVMKDVSEVEGVGHRVVHGGERFVDSVLITDEVLEQIENCAQFAPLHNPHNLRGIKACEVLLPNLPQIAVFDTAFHQTMKPEAYLYGLPLALYRKLGIRRYGFHGTSHRYVAQEAARILDTPITDLKIITCHLGNGASITAVDGGESMDTSMGFTPLEGLIMGTRCGDIDPAIVPYMMKRENLSARDVDSLMNKSSGVLGLSENTNDMREIEDEALSGSEENMFILEIYSRRIKKYIGAYAAALGGLNAIVFTGGVGENSPIVRELSTRGLEFMGVVLDRKKNQASSDIISTGSVDVLVVRTNEELAIARDTIAIIDHAEATRSAQEAEEELSHFSEVLKAEIVLQWGTDRTQGPDDLIKWLEIEKNKKVSLEAMKRLIQVMGLS